MSKKNKEWLAVSIIAAVLIIDQVIKVAVKTNMCWHESIRVTDWFYIFFTENNGMAFGLEIFDKLFLTSFRIIAVCFIVWYLVKILRRNLAKTGYVVCLSLILAGAAGNIIDSMFYGLIFNESSVSSVAHFVPFGEGYEQLFHGKVVDMFYFPIIDTYWPEWMPLIGGDHFIFFSPIFNFADASISVGIIVLILFYSGQLNRKELYSDKVEKEKPNAEE